MTGLLLDTHVWFWYLVGDKRLPRRIRRAMGRRESDLWLSPVSVWELSLLCARGRIRLRDSLRVWVEQALERLPLQEAPLSTAVALRTAELSLPHRDPADRMLAATALTYDLTLATVDERLIGESWLPTLSP